MKALLLQLQEKPTQHPPPNQLTPESAIHGSNDDMPETSTTDAAYNAEPEDGYYKSDDNSSKSWGRSDDGEDDKNSMFKDLSALDPLPDLTPAPGNVNIDLTVGAADSDPLVPGNVDIDLTNGTSGSDPSSESSSNPSSESSSESSSSDPSGKSDVEILTPVPATTTKTRSPFRKNRDLRQGSLPAKKKTQIKHVTVCAARPLLPLPEVPEVGIIPKPWPRPP